MKSVSQIVAQKTGNEEILRKLESLAGTELNSILLELFARRAASLSPAEVLQQFEKNRFTTPSAIDVIAFKSLELQWLQTAAGKGFTPVQLSPLAPFGSCSSFKTINQNNVVSALRGTEAMSDATNILSLLIAQQHKKAKSAQPVKLVTAERLVRAQGLAMPGHTAHFGIFCMATGGFNRGGFLFEMEQFVEHLTLHLALLETFDKNNITVKVLLKENNDALHAGITAALQQISRQYATEITIQHEPNNYYNILQFKTFLRHKGNEINISDGGFVNWSQQLLSNKKHRMLISGIGIELVHKILGGMV